MEPVRSSPARQAAASIFGTLPMICAFLSISWHVGKQAFRNGCDGGRRHHLRRESGPPGDWAHGTRGWPRITSGTRILRSKRRRLLGIYRVGAAIFRVCGGQFLKARHLQNGWTSWQSIMLLRVCRCRTRKATAAPFSMGLPLNRASTPEEPRTDKADTVNRHAHAVQSPIVSVNTMSTWFRAAHLPRPVKGHLGVGRKQYSGAKS